MGEMLYKSCKAVAELNRVEGFDPMAVVSTIQKGKPGGSALFRSKVSEAVVPPLQSKWENQQEAFIGQ